MSQQLAVLREEEFAEMSEISQWEAMTVISVFFGKGLSVQGGSPFSELTLQGL